MKQLCTARKDIEKREKKDKKRREVGYVKKLLIKKWLKLKKGRK